MTKWGRRAPRRIACRMDEISLPGDYTEEGIPSVRATCTRCGHQTHSYGDGEASRKRCLVVMREECPRHESNFYVER